MLENPQTNEEKSVLDQLVSGKSKRDRRKKLVRYLALGLASSIIVGLGLNAFMITENFKSLKLADDATAKKTKAEAATQLAQAATLEAQAATLEAEQDLIELDAKKKEEQEKFDALSQKLQADKAKLEDEKTSLVHEKTLSLIHI